MNEEVENNDFEELEEALENSEKVEETTEEETKYETDNNFSGYFHERDRLDHNNIVDEVKPHLWNIQ